MVVFVLQVGVGMLSAEGSHCSPQDNPKEKKTKVHTLWVGEKKKSKNVKVPCKHWKVLEQHH